MADDVSLRTHGSPELDADAAKLEAIGLDPGPTLEDFFGPDAGAGPEGEDPLYAAYAEHDDDDPRDWDEEDGDDIDCGLMPNGQCLKAGSEECDWDCPNRNSDRFVGSAAWCRKHGVSEA